MSPLEPHDSHSYLRIITHDYLVRAILMEVLTNAQVLLINCCHDDRRSGCVPCVSGPPSFRPERHPLRTCGCRSIAIESRPARLCERCNRCRLSFCEPLTPVLKWGQTRHVLDGSCVSLCIEVPFGGDAPRLRAVNIRNGQAHQSWSNWPFSNCSLQ